MSQIHRTLRKNDTILAVLCGKFTEKQWMPDRLGHEAQVHMLSYPFPKLVTSGKLDVHTLINPTVEQFTEAQHAVQPNLLYIQGQQLENAEIGTLVWGDTDLSDPEVFCSLISPPFPTIVYLEVPIGEKLAKSLHSMGIPYAIYWRNSFSPYAASHFRHALINNHVQSVKFVPRVLGNAPKLNIILPENEVAEEEGCSETFPAIKVYDGDVNMKFLVCGVSCTLDASLLASLEDGMNAQLTIEIRGSKLQYRISARPPLEAETLPHGVVVISQLAVLHMCHFSFLAALKHVLMTSFWKVTSRMKLLSGAS